MYSVRKRVVNLLRLKHRISRKQKNLPLEAKPLTLEARVENVYMTFTGRKHLARVLIRNCIPPG